MGFNPNRREDWSVTLVASALYAVGDHQSTFPASPIRLPDAPAYAFFLNVTVAITDNVDLLDVFIETTLDGGTSYVEVGHFTQILGNVTEGVASQAYLKLSGAAASAGFLGTLDALAEGAVHNVMGDFWRIRTDIIDADANAAFTFSVHAMPMRA